MNSEYVADFASEQAADIVGIHIVAEACIKAQAPGWKNDRTADLWRNSLKVHAYPTLRDMPVAEVDRAAVLRAIETVWTRFM